MKMNLKKLRNYVRRKNYHGMILKKNKKRSYRKILSV